MIISNLNYLESVDEEIFGGVGIDINDTFGLQKTVTSNVDINETFNKTVTLNLEGLNGKGAEVLGRSDSQGDNGFVSIYIWTITGSPT